MLEYDEGIALCCLHCRVVVLQDGYAGGIVVGCGGFGGCGLGEAFGEVETETVYLVFVQQELQVALHELAHQGTFMVEVLEDAVRMRGVCVEVGIVSRGLVLCAVPIQAGKRHVAGGMVVYYIENDGHAFAVAGVNEVFIHFWGAIRLIEGEEETRVVSPAVVPVKLLNRHQLDGVDAHVFQVVQLLQGAVDGAAGGEIAQMHLVDDRLLGVLHLEVGYGPCIVVSLYLEYRNNSFSAFGVGLVVGIGGRRDVVVMLRVENLFAVGICQADGLTAFGSYIVLKCIFFCRVEVVQGYPPTSGGIVATHLAVLLIGQFPVVEVAEDVCKVFVVAFGVFVIEYKSHGGVVDDVDAFFHIPGQGCMLNFGRREALVLMVCDLHKGIDVNPLLAAV